MDSRKSLPGQASTPRPFWYPTEFSDRVNIGSRSVRKLILTHVRTNNLYSGIVPRDRPMPCCAAKSKSFNSSWLQTHFCLSPSRFPSIPTVRIGRPSASTSRSGNHELVGSKSFRAMQNGSAMHVSIIFSSTKKWELLQFECQSHRYEVMKTKILPLTSGRESQHEPVSSLRTRMSIKQYSLVLLVRRSGPRRMSRPVSHRKLHQALEWEGELTMLAVQIASPDRPAFVNPIVQNHQWPTTTLVALILQASGP